MRRRAAPRGRNESLILLVRHLVPINEERLDLDYVGGAFEFVAVVAPHLESPSGNKDHSVRRVDLFWYWRSLRRGANQPGRGRLRLLGRLAGPLHEILLACPQPPGDESGGHGECRDDYPDQDRAPRIAPPNQLLRSSARNGALESPLFLF